MIAKQSAVDTLKDPPRYFCFETPAEYSIMDCLEKFSREGGNRLKIMLSAGEVSGDLHGARIARAILSQAPETVLVGFGGAEMEDAGVRLIENYESYNVMGVLEVLKNLPRIYRLLNTLTDAMKEERPDLLVLIDYPDFNWRLAKRAKALGIPVFSYIPPSAWAWRKGRAASCAKLAEEFVAIFPHELPVYEAAGAKISFVGNPLVDTVKAELPERVARERFAFPAGSHGILLLPGSRRQEIEMLLPDMLQAARRLLVERPETKFYLPVAPGVDESALRAKIDAAGVPVMLTHEARYALMGLMDAGLATSGTVVMEAALMGLPCVVLYRFAPLNYFIGKLLVHIQSFSLPNILLGEPFETELLQDNVTPEAILREILPLYRGEEHRRAVVQKLDKACKRLGPPGASGRVAEKILVAARRHISSNGDET